MALPEESNPKNSCPLLEVVDLSVTFPSEAGPVTAVRGLQYHIMPGEVLGLVGASGAGKSVSALAVMGPLGTAQPKRAYELFLARGREHGHDLEDWFEAERQLQDEQDVGPT